MSIPQELKKTDLIYEADEIGFVFPDYAAAVPVFDMNEQIRIDKNTDENMAGIISDISAHKNFIAPSDMGWFTEEMLQGMQEMHFSQRSEQLIRLDTAKCIRCTTCTEVCPRGNFALSSDGLVINGRCEFCLSCIHNCPQHALSLERERNKDARYRHPV